MRDRPDAEAPDTEQFVATAEWTDVSGMTELRLDALCFGGDAVGRAAGKVVFVPFGAAGDRVVVRVVEDRRSFARAELVEVLEAGAGRRPAPCAHFGVCGGCQWQHASYEQQLVAKEAIVERALATQVPELLPFAAAPFEWGYRRRVRARWRTAADGSAIVGFLQRRSRQIVDVARCPLLVAPLQRALEVCRDRLPRTVGGSAEGALSLLAGAGGEVHLELQVERGGDGAARRLGQLLEAPVVGGQMVRRVPRAGPGRGRPRRGRRGSPGGRRSIAKLEGPPESFGRDAIDLDAGSPAPLWAAASAFAQVNGEQARLLRQRVSSWAAGGERVLELYAGIGSLTRGLAIGGRSVVAVERSKAACELLRRNVEGCDGPVQVLELDALRAVDRLVAAGERFDLVVVDPPREGCAELASRLGALAPRRVVYVSCDPMTLARDLRSLRGSGLVPVCAQGQDMMPQTFHVEVVVSLERVAGAGGVVPHPADRGRDRE